MPEIVPSAEQMTTLVGKPLYEIWTQLCALIDENYDMERLWGSGGKAWTYEYKYRRGGKTLCALYARENCIGFIVILGKDERLKFENDKEHFFSMVIRAFAPPVAFGLAGGIVGLLFTAQGFGYAFPYSLLCIGMRANNPQMELDLLPFALSVLAYLVLFALLSLRYLKKRDIAAE